MAVTSVVEKRLGALPVAAWFLRRLDVAGIVDEVCPGGGSALVTHGQVIEALVANRLTSPAPLVRVEDWARCWAVEEVFGIEPGLLNDDRLARALDAIAPHLEHIAGTIGARAIGEFGIDVARMHWDMTSMSVHWSFPVEGQDEDFPVIGYGHPKDRRFDLKQVQAGLAVSADGGIPLHARVFGGGAAEVSQVVGAMKDLRAMAGEGSPADARPHRISARKVKSALSRYPGSPADARPLTSQNITHLAIAIYAAHPSTPTADTSTPATPTAAGRPGRRDRTLQLLRTDDQRAWSLKELADTLGIAHYRSFCAQLGHWVTDGILSRTGRGLYTLQPEWRSPQRPTPPAKIADSPDPSID
ncbi:DUF4277 domain-containing protein [Streptomyces sp. NPDC050564]|uniref:DUF4277 domain-containing protein n=1 Tax=Streptomyces sp. NPDC050564 TaxID=3365631 RepID=UPI0037A06217